MVEDFGIGLFGGFGYRFKTYASLRGMDRTSGIIFSPDNGNLAVPNYYKDYLEEYTSSFKYNADQAWASQNVQDNDQYLSRWNYIEKASTTSEDTATAALTDAQAVLQDGKAVKVLSADFLNSPGSNIQPRSLYGVDWDLGDILPVKFADISLSAEVMIVWVSLDDRGTERITGKTQVGE